MKKNIVFIILSLYGGGAERVVSLLSNHLFQQGWNVTILLYQRKEHEYSITPGIDIRLLPASKAKTPVGRKVNQIRNLRKILNEINPDIVLPFLAVPVYQTFFASRGKKYKVYATVRNNPDNYPAQKWLRTIVNFCTPKMDGVIYQTESQTRFFPNVKDSLVLHNPVNPEMLQTSYRYNEEPVCIAAFGRLNKQKNHAFLIQAFSGLSEAHSDVVLRIYGEGEEKDNLAGLIQKLGLDNKVQLMGNTKEVGRKLQETDIFVLSSDYEGLPNALIEAMAMGIPCISTSCPTGPEDLIQNGVNGLLVPCNDVDALTLAMEKLLSSYELRCKLGHAAKETIQKGYTVEQVVKKFAEEIQKRL